MKKSIFIYILAATLTLVGAWSCADHRSDYMEEFQTVLYFRNGGEQDITLYRTGEDALYNIPVCKSGRNLESISSAVVMPFSEAQMTAYNINTGSSYALIPSDKFEFVSASGNALQDQSKVTLAFGQKDTYQIITIKMKTVEISALQEADPEKEYVLAFQLFSPNNVADEINLIILRPSIEIPMVSFDDNSLEARNYTSASDPEETFSNSVSLNMDQNNWEFTCSVQAGDQEWLDSYNESHSTTYELLPADSFNFSTTELSFPVGKLKATFEITVNRMGLDMLKEYVIPVILASCSKPEFAVDQKKNSYLIRVRLDPDQITLTGDMVTVSHNQSGDGGGAEALVDGDPTTFWHSPWSSYVTDPSDVYGVYADIKLKTPLKSIVLSYCTRAQNGNGVPTHVVIGVSEDGQTWTVLGDFATDEMAASGTGQWITLPAMKYIPSTFGYLRFGIAESKAGDLRVPSSGAFTAVAELELYGTAN